MLRRSLAAFGRWNSRDHLRNRSKRVGAVHVRSTLGSRGRAGFYSKSHGFRDGLPHDDNAIKGALGCRLGSGLFGARTQTSGMVALDKQTVEINLYGHPSITNPFRNQLERHPRLGDVVAGPSGSAWLAFPCGDAMWGVDSASSSSSPAEPFEQRRSQRAAERSYVVGSASSFLLKAAKPADVWAERTVLLGGVHSSVLLSARMLMQIFGEVHQAEKSSSSSSSFDDFVHNCVVEAHRYCVATRRFQHPALQQPQGDAETASLLPEQFLRGGVSFWRAAIDETPMFLKAILARPPATQHGKQQQQQQQQQQDEQRDSAGVNSLVKWYLRSSDPRAHFGSSGTGGNGGGGGHAARRFSVIAVCPFGEPHARWAGQLRRQGFMDVPDAHVHDPARFLRQVASVVVDDSARRVPLPAHAVEQDNAAGGGDSDAATYGNLVARADESLWLGMREKPYVDDAHALFPHLTLGKQRMYRDRMFMEDSGAAHQRLVHEEEGFAKSHFLF